MREVVVYIHGLVPRDASSHVEDYRAFHDGVSAAGVVLPDFTGPDVVRTEIWSDAAEDLLTADLAQAQRNIGRLLPGELPGRDLLTGRFMRGLRDLLQYAWADAFYYTSPEGEERTRLDVWNQILDAVPVDDDVDLTIVCHSGGTLVAHDFLFYLYSGMRQDRRSEYADGDLWSRAEARWRIDRLVTMGSPLVPLLVRSAGLVESFAADPAYHMEAEVLGLGRDTHWGRRPRWLNLWDVHDIISYPIGRTYGDDDRIRDLYPDVGDWPGSVHDRYWSDRSLHTVVASNWL